MEKITPDLSSYNIQSTGYVSHCVWACGFEPIGIHSHRWQTQKFEGRRLRVKFKPIPQNVEYLAPKSQRRQLGTRDVRATDVAARRSLGHDRLQVNELLDGELGRTDARKALFFSSVKVPVNLCSAFCFYLFQHSWHKKLRDRFGTVSLPG